MNYRTIWESYAILNGSRYLDLRRIVEVIEQAHEMYRGRESTRNVRGDGYEGRLSTKWGTATVASALTGIVFTAVLETDHGRDEMLFVLKDYTEDRHLLVKN